MRFLSGYQILENNIIKSLNSKDGALRVLSIWSSDAVVSISRPYAEDGKDYFNIDKYLREYEFEPKFRNKRLLSKNNLMKLTILQWFLPDSTRGIIHNLIRNNEKRYNLISQEGYFQLMQSKYICISYLEAKYGNYNQLFGWLLQRIVDPTDRTKTVNELSYILEQTLPRKFFVKKKKVLPTQRKRGYTDQGSMGSEYTKTLRQQSEDWTNYEKINEQIDTDKKTADFNAFLEGFLI